MSPNGKENPLNLRTLKGLHKSRSRHFRETKRFEIVMENKTRNLGFVHLVDDEHMRQRWVALQISMRRKVKTRFHSFDDLPFE